MKTRILKLAAERAIQLARFSNFIIRIDGDPIESVLAVSIEGIPIGTDVLVIPVRIGYSDIKADPADLLEELPEISGVVIVPPSGDPIVHGDFTKLGTLRYEFDNRKK